MTFKLLVGQCQSGKTSLILQLCYGLETPVIVILRGRKADEVQFSQRFKQNNQKVKLPYYNVSDLTEKKLNKVFGRGVFVAIGTEAQIRKLCSIKQEFSLIVDEADWVQYGEPDSMFRRLIKELASRAVQKFALTATTFNVILTDCELKPENILVIKPPDNYRGITDITLHSVDDTKDIETNNDKPLYNILSNISAQPFTERTFFLVKNDRLIAKQYQLSRLILTRTDWTDIIIFNGQGLYIHTADMIKMKKIVGHCEVTEVDGVVYLLVKKNISFAMTCCQKYDSKYVAIISDTLADRSISFVTEDYKEHLTYQYYIPAKTTTITSLIQSVRLCGIFNDKRQLNLYTTEQACQELKKGFMLQQEIIETIRYNSGYADEIVKSCVFNAVKIPKRKLGLHSSDILNKIHGDDGGWDTSLYEYSMSFIEPINEQTSVSEHVVVNYVDLTEEGKELYLHIYNNCPRVWTEISLIYRPEKNDRQRVSNWFNKGETVCKKRYISLRKIGAYFEVLVNE